MTHTLQIMCRVGRDVSTPAELFSPLRAGDLKSDPICRSGRFPLEAFLAANGVTEYRHTCLAGRLRTTPAGSAFAPSLRDYPKGRPGGCRAPSPTRSLLGMAGRASSFRVTERIFGRPAIPVRSLDLWHRVGRSIVPPTDNPELRWTCEEQFGYAGAT